MSYLIIAFSIISSWFVANDTLVIAHRGASGYLPEHSVAAKTLAYAQGADYIEQDVVLSKDGVPVVLHDIRLDDVTDVAAVFPHRAREDGHFYAADFVLAELRQLQLLERFNPSTGERRYPGRFPKQPLGLRIVTLEEEIKLIQGLNQVFDRDVGLYVEIKKPHWHRQQGLDISDKVLAVLERNNYRSRQDKIYLQCFDFMETQRLRNELHTDLKLVQLIGENSWKESPTDYDFLKTSEGVQAMSAIVDGVGPSIKQLINEDDQGIGGSDFYHRLKQQQLPIHTYTLRADDLPENVSFEDVSTVLIHLLDVEGIFTDFPDRLRQQL